MLRSARRCFNSAPQMFLPNTAILPQALVPWDASSAHNFGIEFRLVPQLNITLGHNLHSASGPQLKLSCPSRGGCRLQLSCTRTHIPANKRFSYAVNLYLTVRQLRTATASSGSTFGLGLPKQQLDRSNGFGTIQ